MLQAARTACGVAAPRGHILRVPYREQTPGTRVESDGNTVAAVASEGVRSAKQRFAAPG